MLIALATVFSLVSGCQCRGVDPEKTGYDRVVILFSAGRNSLTGYLAEDIQDLKKGYAPTLKDDKVFLVVSHLAAKRGDYSTPTYPSLIRVYSDKKAGVVFDTLKTYTNGNILVGREDMKEVLSDIQRQFKSDHYGLVYTSHASGWLPAGYYENPSYFERNYSGSRKLSARTLPSGAVPYVEPEEIPGAPAVKSIGMCNVMEGGAGVAYEMDLTDFAAYLPMHLDYLLFDCCLNGGIEVAYELKDKCDLIGFSQAEILADGFDYKSLGAQLLEGATANPQAVVESYFQQYAAKTSSSDRAATISLVDCHQLDQLTGVCKTLFEKYRTQIASLNPASVQRYYRTNHHWFYDLEDILVKAGISTAEHSDLTAALNKCIKYKAATDEFLYSYGGFKIETFSGFSMYLPCNGSAYLDAFYKDLAWNKATLLVD